MLFTSVGTINSQYNSLIVFFLTFKCILLYFQKFKNLSVHIIACRF